MIFDNVDKYNFMWISYITKHPLVKLYLHIPMCEVFKSPILRKLTLISPSNKPHIGNFFNICTRIQMNG